MIILHWSMFIVIFGCITGEVLSQLLFYSYNAEFFAYHTILRKFSFKTGKIVTIAYTYFDYVNSYIIIQFIIKFT